MNPTTGTTRLRSQSPLPANSGTEAAPSTKAVSRKSRRAPGSMQQRIEHLVLDERAAVWNIRRPAGFLDAFLELLDFDDPSPAATQRR